MKDKRERPEPLAIIGMACRFPRAENPGEYWSNIIEGVDCIGDIPASHWNVDDYFSPDPKAPDRTYAKRGGFLGSIPFHPLEHGIPPTALEATDTSQLLGMVVAREALWDAGYGKERDFDRDRVSVILGVTGTLELVIPLGARLGHPLWRRALKEAGIEDDRAEAIVNKISAGYVPWQEQSFPGLLGNVVAGRIAKDLDLGGTNCVVDAACASAMSALHLAAMELQSGRADMVLTGGIDTFNDIFMYMCFSKTPALSPSGEARPFDAEGDGTILGEGLGILLLKRLADAKRDGDRVYAVISGMGTASDGKGQAIYAPDSEGQMNALRRAYDQAGIRPSSVALVEGHGTGTKVGDAAEVRALREVFQADGAVSGCCALGSVKSQIGHTKAAAGVAGVMKAALALHHKVLPPTIKVRKPLPDLAENGPLYLNRHARPWLPQETHPRRAGVSAFGFGGSNFHCVLEEVDLQQEAVTWDGRIQILAFSGQDLAELKTALTALDSHADWRELCLIATQSRASFKGRHRHRLLLVVEKEATSWPQIRQHALALLDKYPSKPSWSSPEGIFYGSGKTQGQLGVLFPGQGSQYPGMLQDLACRFPQMQRILAEADRVFESLQGPDETHRLSNLIYPPEQGKEANRRLRQTQNAQPALGAVSIGALGVLDYFGVTPAAAAGHSYGEITALCASNRFSPEVLYLISRLRGQLMAEGGEEHGAMLAVRAPVEQVESLLTEHSLDLVLANKNAPNQMVLSGTTTEIEKAMALFERGQIANKRLPVAAAFHSTLVAKAREPFFAELRDIDFPQAKIPVYSNTTAKPYPDNPEEAKRLLAAQLARPVEFVDQIRNMYEDGVRVFLEVGPDARLTGLVNSILDGADFHALALDASSGKRSPLTDLARVLAAIAAFGFDINLKRWQYGRQPEKTVPRGPVFNLNGANFLDPKTREKRENDASLALRQLVRKPTPAKEKNAGEAALLPETRKQPALTPAPPSPLPRQEFSNKVKDTTKTDPALLQNALALSQKNLQLLQKLQEDTASMHRLFLEGQDRAQQNLKLLIEQQHRFLSGDSSPPVTADVQARPEHQPEAQSVPEASMKPAKRPEVVEQPLVESAPRVPSKTDWDGMIAVIAEKTGYPPEVLTADMKLDADLGIDSIKRVEIFSSLQEAMPGMDAVQPEMVAKIQTLGEIAQLLVPHEAPSQVAEAAAPARPSGEHRSAQVLLEVVAEKTGYPAEMLEWDMRLDADLGIDSIKRVEILSAFREAAPDLPEINPEDMSRFQTLGDIAALLDRSEKQPAQPVQTMDGEHGRDQLFEVISEKTGYPVETLAEDMRLDADLGIDSIKKVEIFSGLQERMPSLGEVSPERMNGLQTLGEIVTYLQKRSGPAPNAPTMLPAGQNDPAFIGATLRRVVADKTGYPMETLEMDMGLESDLGIDSIKRVEILSALQEAIPGLGEVNPERMTQIHTLAEIVAYFTDTKISRPAPKKAITANAAPAKTTTLERGVLDLIPVPEQRQERNLQGEVWVLDDGSPWALAIENSLVHRGLSVRMLELGQFDALSTEAPLAGLLVLAPEDQTVQDFPRAAFALVQKMAKPLRQNGAFLASVSRLDGAFGLENLGPDRNPEYGGLAGLVKTAAQEWPEVHCKALDVAAEGDLDTLAERVAEELFLEGPPEVALTENQGRCLSLVPRQEPKARQRFLEKGDLIVVSGGARGVTAETAKALAEKVKPTLVLLGRSPLPEPEEPAWLRTLSAEAAIKKALLEQGYGPAPARLQQAYREVLAAREIRQNMAHMRDSGARVLYRSVDLNNGESLHGELHRLRAELGPVKGLIHGAGVLADKLIEDKTLEQFDHVYRTKVGGLCSLLEALAEEDLKIMVLYSSSTARFGRRGQADYAMANEALNKIARQQALARPQCKLLSVNWGPWDGGMVTPALRNLFQAEGIGLIPLEAGAAYMMEELCGECPGPVEVVVTGALPDRTPPISKTSPAEAKKASPAFEIELGIDDYPFLKAHVIDGKAVLPTVMMAEWMAHAAIHANPGLRFAGFENLLVLKGIVLDKEKTQLRFFAGKAVHRGGVFVAPCEIRGGSQSERVHARADLLLADRPLTAPRESLDFACDRSNRQGSEIYPHVFHGPQFQGIKQLEGIGAEGVRALVKTAPAPAEWIRHPLRGDWYADPLVLDCGLQMMILWCLENHGMLSMPARILDYRQFQAFRAADIRIAVKVTRVQGQLAEADMDFLHAETGNLIARLRGYQCVMDTNLVARFANNRLPQTTHP